VAAADGVKLKPRAARSCRAQALAIRDAFADRPGDRGSTCAMPRSRAAYALHGVNAVRSRYERDWPQGEGRRVANGRNREVSK
jgi:hypothetical protein